MSSPLADRVTYFADRVSNFANRAAQNFYQKVCVF